MAKTNKARLVQAAAHARQKAVAPYSKFKVGAALLTKNGKIITGANVESASYGLTCCAERVALFLRLLRESEILSRSRLLPSHPAGQCPVARAVNCSPNMRPTP
jgi:homotetrameric cytidine deaminase